MTTDGVALANWNSRRCLSPTPYVGEKRVSQSRMGVHRSNVPLHRRVNRNGYNQWCTMPHTEQQHLFVTPNRIHTPRLIDSFAPCAVIKFANYLSVVGLTYQYIYNVRWYFRYLLHMSLWLHVLAQEINHKFDVFCRRVLSNEYAGAVHRNWLQPQIGDIYSVSERVETLIRGDWYSCDVQVDALRKKFAHENRIKSKCTLLFIKETNVLTAFLFCHHGIQTVRQTFSENCL